MEFSNLAEASTYLEKTFKNRQLKKANWSPYKTFVHCAQTIDYAIDGYPKYQPLIVQNTIGKIVIHRFLKQGFMKHDLTAPVAGSPSISEQGTDGEGLNILLEAISRFQSHNGALQRHLIFGKLSKSQYDTYYCMHISDHLTEFEEL